jgi:hypothetical protein
VRFTLIVCNFHRFVLFIERKVEVPIIKPEIPEENSDDQPPACKKSKREERKRARGTFYSVLWVPILTIIVDCRSKQSQGSSMESRSIQADVQLFDCRIGGRALAQLQQKQMLGNARRQGIFE